MEVQLACRILYEIHPETGRDLGVLPLGGDPEEFLATPSDEHALRLSPNGRWLAYVSDKSGQHEGMPRISV